MYKAEVLTGTCRRLNGCCYAVIRKIADRIPPHSVSEHLGKFGNKFGNMQRWRHSFQTGKTALFEQQKRPPIRSVLRRHTVRNRTAAPALALWMKAHMPKNCFWLSIATEYCG